jgi:hypothetical protein
MSTEDGHVTTSAASPTPRCNTAQPTVIQAQPLQTIVQPLDQVLPAQSSAVQLLSTGTEEDLGGDDVVGPLPTHLVQDSAHLDLGVSFGVTLGGV